MNYVIFLKCPTIVEMKWLCRNRETFVEFLEGIELISSIVKGAFFPHFR